MRVSIAVAERIISIDGLTYMLGADAFPSPQNINGKPADGVQAIVWNGDDMFGHVQGGGGEPFRDPAVISPYVAAWEKFHGEAMAAAQAIADGMVKKKSDEAAAYTKLLADLKAEDDARKAAAKAD